MRRLIGLAALATTPLVCVSAIAGPVCPFDASAVVALAGLTLLSTAT